MKYAINEKIQWWYFIADVMVLMISFREKIPAPHVTPSFNFLDLSFITYKMEMIPPTL